MTVIIFCLSAGMHALSTIFRDRSCTIWPVVYWFSLMGVGMVFEDLVQAMFSYIVGRRKEVVNDGDSDGDRDGGSWRHVVGYLWVWFFFSWSLPKLVFPNVECGSQ